MSIAELIKTEGTVILDVRTPAEFSGGAVAGSVNIPLQELERRMGELRTVNGNIVCCCASGMRSGVATQILHNAGITNACNGGSWMDVNYWKHL